MLSRQAPPSGGSSFDFVRRFQDYQVGVPPAANDWQHSELMKKRNAIPYTIDIRAPECHLTDHRDHVEHLFWDIKVKSWWKEETAESGTHEYEWTVSVRENMSPPGEPYKLRLLGVRVKLLHQLFAQHNTTGDYAHVISTSSSSVMHLKTGYWENFGSSGHIERTHPISFGATELVPRFQMNLPVKDIFSICVLGFDFLNTRVGSNEYDHSVVECNDNPKEFRPSPIRTEDILRSGPLIPLEKRGDFYDEYLRLKQQAADAKIKAESDQNQKHARRQFYMNRFS